MTTMAFHLICAANLSKQTEPPLLKVSIAHVDLVFNLSNHRCLQEILTVKVKIL